VHRLPASIFIEQVDAAAWKQGAGRVARAGRRRQAASTARRQAWMSLFKRADCRAARVTGLMLLPPFTPDPEDARPYVKPFRALRDELAGRVVPLAMLRELSMGMSHDFEVAVEEGATIIRVGTAIFGER
jgi:uncharacterized pyridoxal phosphate-containing UPF0001 family protein